MPDPTTTVLAIQRAVACASPSAWRDLVAVDGAGGLVTLTSLDGAEIVVVTDAEPAPGEPVAFHPVADVLAIGARWFAARPV